MTVQIKPLKGFKNYLNNEFNTMSLLVKSDLELKEHLSNAREKLLVSLTNIMDNYNSSHIIYFYHKVQVLYGKKTEYLSTKASFTKSHTLKRDLNDSIKDLLKLAYGKLKSHFVNITILLNDKELNLSKDEFINLNWKIRSNLSKMDNKEPIFVDNNDIEKKNKKVYAVKPIKKNNNSSDSLFIDDDSLFIDEVKPIKKNNNSSDSLFIDDDSLFIDEVKPIKKNNNSSDSLFIDDDSLFIDEVKPIKKNKKVDDVKQIKKNNKCNKPLFIDDYSKWCDHGKWFD